MPVAVWKTIEKQMLKNDEIAASATQTIVSTPLRVDAYNMLLVQNFDVNSNIEVRLNDRNSTNANEKFFCQRNGGFVNIGADVPIWFQSVHLVNSNSGAVVAANSVIVRVAKVVPAVIHAVGEPISSIGSPTSQTGFVIG